MLRKALRPGIAAAGLIGLLGCTDTETIWNPMRLGPYDVGHRTTNIDVPGTEDREIEVHFWFPGTAPAGAPFVQYEMSAGLLSLDIPAPFAKSNVAIADGVFPFIVFSHGWNSHALVDVETLEWIASRGFVVAALVHKGNDFNASFGAAEQDWHETLEQRLRDVRAVIEMPEVDGVPPPGKRVVGLAGVSAGGFTALLSAGGLSPKGEKGPVDPQIRSVVAVAPAWDLGVQAASSIEQPLLVFSGGQDAVVPPIHNAAPAFEGAQSPVKALLEVTEANHFHFSGVCRLGRALIAAGIDEETWKTLNLKDLIVAYDSACTEDAFPAERVVELLQTFSVAHFMNTLKATQRCGEWTDPGRVAACESDVVLFAEGQQEGFGAQSCSDYLCGAGSGKGKTVAP